MRTVIAIAALSLSGCATLTTDAMQPVAFSFSNGDEGYCEFENKRGRWDAELPDVVDIRRSDDLLRYECETETGATAKGTIASSVGAKIVASAVFIDFGITDAITDKHRSYPDSFVIPVKKAAR